MKLDPVKVEWIVRQKEEGALTNRAMAESMRASRMTICHLNVSEFIQEWLGSLLQDKTATLCGLS